MEDQPSFIQFVSNNAEKLLEQSLEHVGLTFISLMLAILVAVPAGIYITRKPKIASFVLGFAGILQTVPSIALLGFMIPLLGIGTQPAVFALFLYALLPIIRNTYTGIQEVENAVIEAAKGMGMTSWQILMQVELPLSLPVIFAGIRTATVINVGVATLAAYIGAGGLGEFIFGGIALNNSHMILAGAIPAAILAIVFDQLLAKVQRRRQVRIAHFLLAISLLFPTMSLAYFLPQQLVSGITAGFDPEFYGRKDGYPALRDIYGLSFNTVLLNSTLMYEAIHERQVSVISGYSTDGRIKAYDLAILEDDQHAFPPYYCTPVVGKRVKETFPEVIDALNLLAGKINDSTMTALNYQIDFLKMPVSQVAQDFLTSLDLWQPDRAQGGEKIVIGSKIFTEQYLLVEIFSQLIDGHTDLDVDPRPGLGGTKICFDAVRLGEIDLYPEYTGTGFQVILSPDEATKNRLISQPDAVYDYVRTAFEQEFEVYWLQPLGFNNTYAMMVRRELAQQNGWRTVSDLAQTLEEKY